MPRELVGPSVEQMVLVAALLALAVVVLGMRLWRANRQVDELVGDRSELVMPVPWDDDDVWRIAEAADVVEDVR